ncbi:MAG: hypothetical protein J6C57_06535, partial [Paludibacteraceae bacterium]|nr:hypothetical protein [Paludibacteraceae bacterium]
LNRLQRYTFFLRCARKIAFLVFLVSGVDGSGVKAATMSQFRGRSWSSYIKETFLGNESKVYVF